MTVAIVILLAVVAIELGVLLWALARPVLALARAAEAAAGITEALERYVTKLAGPAPFEELVDNFRSTLATVRGAREEEADHE